MRLRVRMVLRKRPGLSIPEIRDELRRQHYVATTQGVSVTIDNFPQDFRCEGMHPSARWFTVVPDGDALPRTPRPSVDAAAIRELTRDRRISKLFHWSPAAAIRSVLELGLLSPNELDRRGVHYQAHRYGSPAKQAALAAFVSTSLQPKAQMMFTRCHDPVLWELDPQIATVDGALFVRDNSAKAGLDLSDILRSTGLESYRIAIDTLIAGTGQVEILIPETVPTAVIRTVIAYDAQAADAAEKWLAEKGTNIALVRMASVQWRTGPGSLPF